MTSIAGALTAAAERLRAAGVPSPAVDARLLLRHALGRSAAQVSVAAPTPLAPAQLAAFDALVDRRVGREPLQRIIGTVGFRRLDIAVADGVFIPRPETEVLVDLVCARAPEGALVVEPCTGSGAVAAALADERPDLRIVATDRDPRAVAAARRTTAQIADRVEVHVGDLLEPLDAGLRGSVDVLVCNPPYLAVGELDGLAPEVVTGDPPGALVAGPTGHEVTDRLITAAGGWLRPGGLLALEVDARRAEAVAARCADARLAHSTVHRDLTGAQRFVTAHRARVVRDDLSGRRPDDAYSWQR